ncbi:MAG: penicillin-binding protein 1C [Pseudomonadota bacterium]
MWRRQREGQRKGQRPVGGPLRDHGRDHGRHLRKAIVLTLLMASAGALYAAHEGWRRLEAQLGPLPLARAKTTSPIVVDRNGALLRAYTTASGHWRLPARARDVDQRYLKMLIAYEDARFHSHYGIDPLAIVRAGYLLVRYGRLRSGASTLTMQVARLLDGVHERSAMGKLRQMVRARQLERRFSKAEILDLYMRLAPFGGNIEGVRAASLSYFGIEPRRLSVAQAALLVALPQAPSARRPDRHPKRARRARAKVLARMVKAGVITRAEQARALQAAIPKRRRAFPALAPHLSDRVRAAQPHRLIHRLTLKRRLQIQLQRLARRHAQQHGARLSAALLAIDHASGEIIAHVGSAGFFDETRFGAIDMTAALRSPGSTLKPLVYGLGFERGVIHPETLIEDRPVRFGRYRPRNFDKTYSGTVTVREALARSLNIPAVKVLHAVGPGALLGRFKRVGVEVALPEATTPGLPVALGGLGMTMRELAALYVGMARGGDAIRLRHLRAPRVDGDAVAALGTRHGEAEPNVALLKAVGFRRGHARLLEPAAAWHVADILKMAPAPDGARRGRIAYKTGTSYGFRDAWAAGFDGRHTVVAWIGRPDGAATPGLLGRLAAAPLLFDTFAHVAKRTTPLARAPDGTLRARGADLPPPLKRFRDDGVGPEARGPYLAQPLAIAFPPDRAQLEIAMAPSRSIARVQWSVANAELPKPEPEPEQEPVMLRASGGTLPLTWLVDGRVLKASPHERHVWWQPREPGFVTFVVIDAAGRTARASVRLRASAP